MASRFRPRLRDPNEFPTVQLLVLAIVRLSEPIALTSIYPYSWELVKRFGVGNEKNASFYSGLLISAFSLAEAMSGMFWGSLSDKVGRKPILLCGCAGTVISLLIIGFAQSFWVALAGRAIGGVLNGNIAVIQTVVGELVTKPEHEPRAYSVMPFVWSMGTIIGPAIGGTFVDPSVSFPRIFSPDGLFAEYPYLLSNLVCASILMISILTGYFYLEETHPKMKAPLLNLPAPTYTSEETSLITRAELQKDTVVISCVKAYGTCEIREEDIGKKKHKKCQPRVFTKRIIQLVIAMGIFSYHCMSFDQLFPIFLEDERASLSLASVKGITWLQSSGGLGLTVQQVGFIMSVDGFLALIVQAVIFPFVAGYFGMQRCFLIASVLQPTTFFIMSFLIYVPAQWVNLAIYVLLAFRNTLTIVAFSALLISLKEATPSVTNLGKVNGLAASVGAACRTIAPPVSGYLYSLGSHYKLVGFVWYATAIVAGIGAIQAFAVRGIGTRGDEEDWSNEEVPTLVNTSLNPSDDERDGDYSITTGSESDTSDESL